MEWQAVVLVMQILMLAVGWFLFQQAKGELSARAAETPVLGEVKALQRSIKQLLADLEQTSERASQHLETQCRQARELADTLSDQMRGLEAEMVRFQSRHSDDEAALLPPLSMVTGQNIAYSQETLRFVREDMPAHIDKANIAATGMSLPSSAREQRHTRVFALADAGQTSGEIARETGFSEGEIETLLGLRLQRA